MALTYKEDGRPSFQFYPDDWIAETGLRLCSLNAKGLWIEMLCIMFYNKPRGLLIANGLQINNKMLAKILGEEERSIASSVQELEGYKVFSRMPDGTIYSRRMYNQSLQESHLKEVRSEAGKKGMEKRWKKGGNKKITNITPPSSSPTTSPSSKRKSKEKNKHSLSKKDKNLILKNQKHYLETYGIDLKYIQNFFDQCEAKNYKYANFGKALLVWFKKDNPDWEKRKPKYKPPDLNCPKCKDHPGIMYTKDGKETMVCDCTIIRRK